MLNVDRVRDALAPIPATASGTVVRRSRAGVAIVLAGPHDAPSLCFMQRVQRRGDRWSGDVALPGGWAHEHERHLRETAVRETREEVGLHLLPAHHLGDLEPMPISRHAGERSVIGASAFYLGSELPALEADPREVADAFWIRCADLYDPVNRTRVRWSRSGPPTARPAVRVDGHIIWGLTYRVLVRFSDRVLGSRSTLMHDAGT